MRKSVCWNAREAFQHAQVESASTQNERLLAVAPAGGIWKVAVSTCALATCNFTAIAPGQLSLPICRIWESGIADA